MRVLGLKACITTAQLFEIFLKALRHCLKLSPELKRTVMSQQRSFAKTTFRAEPVPTPCLQRGVQAATPGRSFTSYWFYLSHVHVSYRLGMASPLLLCGSWGLNSGCKTWQQVPFVHCTIPPVEQEKLWYSLTSSGCTHNLHFAELEDHWSLVTLQDHLFYLYRGRVSSTP